MEVEGKNLTQRHRSNRNKVIIFSMSSSKAIVSHLALQFTFQFAYTGGKLGSHSQLG